MVISCDEESENIPTQFDSVKTFLEDGWISYQTGNYQEAIDLFTEAVERQAGNLEAHAGIAWSNYHMDDLADAEAKFNFIVSLATLNNDVERLTDAHAGLCLTGNKLKIVAENEGKPEMEILNIKLDKIILNGNEVLNLNSQYAHTYEPDVINAGNIGVAVAQSYFNIYYFYDAVLKIDQIVPNYLSELLATVAHTVQIDTFFTQDLTEDQELFLDWETSNIITLDDVKSSDGGAEAAEYVIIEGANLKLNSDLDLYTEQLVVQDSLIDGDTLTIVIPSNEQAYLSESTLDDQGLSVRTEVAADDDDELLGYFILSDISAGSTVTVTYRYHRKLSISFKRTSDFYKYLDLITTKLYQLSSS
jgi:tetratricopeptide (TPR) repeat protein